MAHTQVWDSAYENIPADNDQASEGALRIRNLKRDIRQRAEIDHDWDDVTDAGKHKQVVFVDPLGAKPTLTASEGALYTKDISTKAELFWEDEDGDELQLTSGGLLNPNIVFASGTKMLFQQTAAPTNWTKDTTHNNKALRLQTGTVTTGGTNTFSAALNTAFASAATVLTEANLAAHTHTGPSHTHGAGSLTIPFRQTSSSGTTGGADTYVDSVATTAVSGSSAAAGTGATGSTGGGTGHTHNVDLDVQFVDVIIATKD